MDEEKTAQLIDKVYNGINADSSLEGAENSSIVETEIKKESSEGKNIAVFNGGYTTGLAKKTKNILSDFADGKIRC